MINYQESTLLNLIKSHPEGIKEYDLLKLLAEQKTQDQKTSTFDMLVLFQQHFLLFHALYKLSNQLRADQAGHLIIEALNIQWVPYYADSAEKNALALPDPLQEYYLNLDNLENTSSDDVDNLLASFWVKMSDDGEKLTALALFELTEPCDLAMIKKRYRQLLAIHHPDKGGTVETTQAINDAMAILKRCYSIV